MVGGEDRASRYRDESINEDYDVQLRLDEKDRSDVATIHVFTCPHRAAAWCVSITW